MNRPVPHTSAGRLALAERKLRRARRLYEASHDHRETADELASEAGRLVEEASALRLNLAPPRLIRRVLPDLRH